MKTKNLSALLITGAISLGAAPAMAESSNAPQLSFACQMTDGVPTTVAQNEQGQTKTVFSWKEDALAYKTPSTPKELCDKVTAKLDAYSADYDFSKVTFVGTQELGLPVICAATERNECSKVLFTLTASNQPAIEADTVVTAILSPELQGKKTIYNDRGVQSTSYEVNFWDLFRFAPKGIFK